MDGTQVLALVAFVALSLALLLALRGTGQVIATSRADEAFRRDVADIVGRAAAALGPVLVHADPARYQTAPLPELEPAVTQGASELAALTSEMGSISVPKGRRSDHDTMSRDLSTATDALGALGADLREDPAPAIERRRRLKRSYLALAHAGRSLAEHGNALAADRPRPDRRGR